MKKRILLNYLLLLTPSLIFCQVFIQGYQDVVNKVLQANTNNNLTDFENLGIKMRGTAQLTNTLNWIKNKYNSYGYTTSQVVESPFTYFFSGTNYTSKNLIITKTGTLYPNRYVILCAHYDSINGTGTNDNGTGTSILLEVARLLQNIPTEYSIKFIHFSGEEDGLHGSEHYVSNVVNGSNPKLDIKLVFNIDEIGGVAGLINDTITCERDESTSPDTNNAASNTITNELVKCVTLYTNLKTKVARAYASDYIPFETNNEIITGFFETNESRVRHTANDLLKNMDPVYANTVTKAVVGAMLHFAGAKVSNFDAEIYNTESQVTLYPNPVSNELYVDKGILDESFYTIKIVDLNGKTIMNKNFDNTLSVNKIDITELVSGIYMCVIETDNKQILKKMKVK